MYENVDTMSYICAFILTLFKFKSQMTQLTFNVRPALKPPSDNKNAPRTSITRQQHREMAESAMDQCHCCKQWFLRIEGHYAKSNGACFPVPLMGGQTKRSRTAKTRKQVESNDSSDNTDSMLGTEVVTSKPCIAGDSGEDVRSTRSKRK
jgi:hypothetical protein